MELFKYFAIFTGSGVGIFLLVLFLLWIIDRFFNLSSNTLGILAVSTWILTLIITPLIVHELFDVKYPENPIDITTQIYNNNEELKELTLQINLLKNALENPKELTLKQIEDVLSNSLNYSEKMKILLFKNDSIIGLLKDEIEIERQNAEKSRQMAENLRSLTKEQIESVKIVITEDAKEASKNSFINGILFSIPIGFLMSLLASFLFKKWGEIMINNIKKKK